MGMTLCFLTNSGKQKRRQREAQKALEENLFFTPIIFSGTTFTLPGCAEKNLS
jgi:hypothetical protein